MKVKTVFISDVHLGTRKSQPDKLLEVFKNYEFDNLVIIGDFIDLTSLKRKVYWSQDHSTVIQKILRMSRKGVDVTYLLGNHDFYLRELIKDGDISLGDIKLCDEIIYTTQKGESIYICHGDIFDGFIRMHPFLYLIGDHAYELSIKLNTVYNWCRRILRMKPWSLSKYLKENVKNAISYVNNFKEIAYRHIEDKKCNSIMIGHIHTPAIESILNKTYYNTGDFCETCSFLIEDLNGDIKLILC